MRSRYALFINNNHDVVRRYLLKRTGKFWHYTHFATINNLKWVPYESTVGPTPVPDNLFDQFKMNNCSIRLLSRAEYFVEIL